MTNVQIFGTKKSQATRAAERFFKERRTAIQFVDLDRKPMAPGEIRRFLDRFGLDGLLDRTGKAWADSGLEYLRVSEAELLARIEKNPALLRLPLVRFAGRLAVGQDPEGWAAIAASVSSGTPGRS